MSEDPSVKNPEIHEILIRTQDDRIKFRGQGMPALTTLLHVICEGDRKRFGEAVHLVELFIEEALRVRT